METTIMVGISAAKSRHRNQQQHTYRYHEIFSYYIPSSIQSFFQSMCSRLEQTGSSSFGLQDPGHQMISKRALSKQFLLWRVSSAL